MERPMKFLWNSQPKKKKTSVLSKEKEKIKRSIKGKNREREKNENDIISSEVSNSLAPTNLG